MKTLILTALMAGVCFAAPGFAQDAAPDAAMAPTPETAAPEQAMPDGADADAMTDGAAVADTLQGADAFADITDEGERSVAIFEEMGKVLTHPRCLNCHPVTNGPTQGDDMHPHNPPVVRGEADFGAPGMNCSTCHGTENVALTTGSGGSIPGHDPWSLAPASMGWQGVSIADICVQLKDPERNGGRSLEDLFEHNATDGLVGWGWNPGQGRTPAPGSQEMFGELTRAWIDTGAACPV